MRRADPQRTVQGDVAWAGLNTSHHAPAPGEAVVARPASDARAHREAFRSAAEDDTDVAMRRGGSRPFLPPPTPSPTKRLHATSSALGASSTYAAFVMSHSSGGAAAAASADRIMPGDAVDSGLYEHAHVGELERAIDAWRQRALNYVVGEDPATVRLHRQQQSVNDVAMPNLAREMYAAQTVPSVEKEAEARDEVCGLPREYTERGGDAVSAPSARSPLAETRAARFVAEARVLALEKENARLRADASEALRLRDALEGALDAHARDVQQLTKEVQAAAAYIDELEVARAESSRAESSRAESRTASCAHVLDTAAADDSPRVPSSSSSSSSALLDDRQWHESVEVLRQLASVTCATAEVCGALQRQCAAVVSRFSTHTSNTTDNDARAKAAFSGLDCQPAPALVALARAPSGEALTSVARDARALMRAEDDARGAAPSTFAAAMTHIQLDVCTTLVRQWERLQQSLDVAVETIRASEKVHQNREHALGALEMLCERQKKELLAARSATHDATRLRDLVSEQAVRLEALQRAKGELMEENQYLRHEYAMEGTTTAAEAEAAAATQDLAVDQAVEIEYLRSECARLRDLVRNEQARVALLENAARAAAVAAATPVQARVLLKTPALSSAPLSVVDAVYTSALDTADSPTTPARSAGQTTRRVATVATAAAVGSSRPSADGEAAPEYRDVVTGHRGVDARVATTCASSPPLVVPQPWQSATTHAVVRGSHRDSTPQEPTNAASSASASSLGGRALAASIYARAQRWQPHDTAEAVRRGVREDSVGPLPPPRQLRRQYPQDEEEEDGFVNSASVSPSPLHSRGQRGFDSWQDRFRAVMETSLDDV